MPACPRCARPVALAGTRCLYCGSDLSATAGPAATAPPPPDAPERTLVVLDLHAVPAEALAAALGLSALEAARRAEHGGFHLHRIARPADAEARARRLASMGLRPWLIPEAEVRARARPRVVRGGAWDAGTLVLHGNGDTLRVRSADLLLAVRGPIVREYQPSLQLKRLRTATLEDGYRIHLHLVPAGPPLEVDPGDFEFSAHASAFASSRLVISGWIEELRAGAPLDDEFRRQPAVLAPESVSRGALGVAEVLRPTRGSDAPLILDNLAQFRFYSAWRAIVERRRRSPA